MRAIKEVYNIYNKQKLHRLINALFLIAAISYPMGSILIIVLYAILMSEKFPSLRKRVIIFITCNMLIAFVMVGIMLLDYLQAFKMIYIPLYNLVYAISQLAFSNNNNIFECFIRYVFFPYPTRFIIPVFFVGIAAITDYKIVWSSNREIHKEEHGYALKIPDVYSMKSILKVKQHTIIFGTTGTGKSLFLQHIIRDSINNNHPLFIVSGKKAGKDKYSLLKITQDYCQEYDRKLAVVSADPNVSNRVPFNPFQFMDEIQIADLLCSCSEFSEEYYKRHFSLWVKNVLFLLDKAKIPFSLEALLDFYFWDDYVSLLEVLRKKDIISEKYYQKSLKLKVSADVAVNSASRFQDIMQGTEGEFLFCNTENATNCYQAYKSNTVLFLDLDSFKYNDFTMMLGKFFIADMKNIISKEEQADEEHMKRIILDELASFVGPDDKSLWPLYSQSRAYGYQIVAASQTKRDLDTVSEEFADQIIVNSGMKVIFRDENDSEDIANIIGTYKSIETTYKTDNKWIDNAGTKKYIDRFRVSPNIIKNLPKKVAIVVNKEEKILCKLHIPLP